MKNDKNEFGLQDYLGYTIISYKKITIVSAQIKLSK